MQARLGRNEEDVNSVSSAPTMSRFSSPSNSIVNQRRIVSASSSVEGRIKVEIIVDLAPKFEMIHFKYTYDNWIELIIICLFPSLKY